jgi:hypothetical protein
MGSMATRCISIGHTPAGLRLAGWAGAAHSLPQGQPPHTAVHQGRLSIDLQNATVGQVLAQIAQHAGIVIRMSLGSEKQVSAQFSNIALETGLRLLLQRASLSHAMRYAQGPSGVAVLTEVQVFEEKKEATPSQGSGVKSYVQEWTAVEDRDAVQLFTEILDRAHQDLPSSGAEEGELAHSFRMALEYVQQLDQTK